MPEPACTRATRAGSCSLVPIALLVGALLSAVPAQAQWAWVETSSGYRSERSQGIAVDASGNVFVTGPFWGEATFGGTTLNNQSGSYSDGFLVKYDPDGTGLWARPMGSTREVDPRALAVDAEGYVYVAGRFWGTATFGDTTLTAPPISVGDGFVAKYDPDGDVAWVQRVGGTVGPYAHHPNGIAVGPDGSVYFTGSFSETATFGPHTLTSAGSRDLFLARMTPDGAFVWAQRGGGPADDSGNGLTIDAAGGVYVAGSFRHTATFGDTTVVSMEVADPLLARYLPDGTLDWVQQGRSPRDGAGGDVGLDAGGNVYVSGVFSQRVTFGDETLVAPNNFNDGFLVKYGPGGDVLWARRVGGPWGDAILSVAVDETGRAYVTGDFTETATFGDLTVTGYGGPEFFLAAFSPDGEAEWVEPANGADPSNGNAVALYPTGDLAFTGGFVGPLTLGTIVLHNTSDPGQQDMFVARYQLETPTAGESEGVGPGAFALEAAYPNPFSRRASFTLSIRDPQRVEVTVHDVLGRRVTTLYDGTLRAGTHTLGLDGSGLPSGVYVLLVAGDAFRTSQRVTLVR